MPLYILLLRQFFRALPRELEDATRIDGASWLRVFWTIDAPWARPALAVIATFTFLQTWTNFFYPLIFLHSSDQATLALGLAYYTTAVDQPWQLIMPITVLMMIVPKVFDEAGVKYPTDSWTGNDFRDAAKKLVKRDASGQVIDPPSDMMIESSVL